ncbi:MAG: UvrD-helicase domain-containing protein [Acidobacteriia bacterium]|nr:UvrD-helicase domain-containing protein [Terriglobia bacterium]
MLQLTKKLNPQQIEAVETTEGPLLILAGAGSGKTRVITFRIGHLIENKKVIPNKILGVTFTNKAAQQMKERVQTLLTPGRTGNPALSTFHSFCVRVLRRDITVIGQGRDFTIYDSTDQLKLIKTCLKEMGLEDRVLSPRWTLSRISEAKNKGKHPETLYQQAYDEKIERLAVAFDLYQKKLAEANALDFDDLLLKTVELLEQHDDIRKRLNNHFEYLMVDEYQDTNHAQYRLIRLLTQDHQNICVVGDEDQSIYSWRGADIQNILNFEEDYHRVKVIKLEQNYRSTKNILGAASAVVANNQARKGKRLWTEKENGSLIRFYEGSDAEDESLFVIQQILAHQRLEPDDQVAVLYRTNFQSRYFEEACRRYSLQYSVVGGFSFYERAEIKDLLSYLKVTSNPKDRISLLRIINTPPRGIGKVTVETLQNESQSSQRSILEVIEHVISTNKLSPRALRALKGFNKQIQSFKQALDNKPLPELLDLILEESGYVRWLREEGTEESQTRLENLQELVNAARDSEDRGETLHEFLDHAALVSETDNYDEKSKVSLMTIHSAKGLEFPLVCLVGVEEGLFPHSRTLSDSNDIEEERRLCYVALTRAQKRLVLTRAKYRRFLGGESFNETEVSRFIGEIPVELIENEKKSVNVKKKTYDGPSYNDAESIKEFYRKRGKTIDFLPQKQKNFGKTFRVGHYVRHPKFGTGSVVRCEGLGDDSKLTVNFSRFGLKKLIVKYAGLKKV